MATNHPFELLLEWSLSLPLQDILHLSLTSRHFYRQINRNPYYWRLKAQLLFGLDRTSLGPRYWKQICFCRGRIRQYRWRNRSHIVSGIRAKQISSSPNHTLCIDLEDKVWLWNFPSRIPVRFLNFDQKVKKIVAEEETSYLLTYSGDLYFVGRNIGDESITFKLARLDVTEPIVDFSVTGPTLLAIDDKGQLWCGGLFDRGIRCVPPAQILVRRKVERVITSKYHHAIITSDKMVQLFRAHGEDLRTFFQHHLQIDPRIKDIGFSKNRTVVLYMDGGYSLFHSGGLMLQRGTGADSIVVGEELILIFNRERDLIYKENPTLTELPRASQISPVEGGLDLIEQ